MRIVLKLLACFGVAWLATTAFEVGRVVIAYADWQDELIADHCVAPDADAIERAVRSNSTVANRIAYFWIDAQTPDAIGTAACGRNCVRNVAGEGNGIQFDDSLASR